MKTINEILKPKTKEEISKSLETLRIPSFRLSTYLNLNRNNDLRKLTIKRFCLSLHINPTKMEITMNLAESIESLYDIAFDRFRKYVTHYNGYEYLPIYNIMRYNRPKSYQKVFIFPKDKINKILQTIINDPLTDI